MAVLRVDDNHVRLLVTAHTESVPDLIQSLGLRYVCYINWTYRRTGTLWEGRDGEARHPQNLGV